MPSEITLLDIHKTLFNSFGDEGSLIFGRFLDNQFMRSLVLDGDPDNIDANGSKLAHLLVELPDVITRQFNQSFETTAGRTEPKQFPSNLFGNLVNQEFMFEILRGARPRMSTQLEWLGKAMTHFSAAALIDGDPVLDPDQIWGLKAIAQLFDDLGFGTVISMDDGSGGGPLQYATLQQLIKRIEPKRNILMVASDDIEIVLSTGARDPAVIHIEHTKDGFGDLQTTFQGMPILDPGRDINGDDILAFNEPDAGVSNFDTGSLILVANTVFEGGWHPFTPYTPVVFPVKELDDPTRLQGGAQASLGTSFANPESVIWIKEIDFVGMV